MTKERRISIRLYWCLPLSCFGADELRPEHRSRAMIVANPFSNFFFHIIDEVPVLTYAKEQSRVLQVYWDVELRSHYAHSRGLL